MKRITVACLLLVIVSVVMVLVYSRRPEPKQLPETAQLTLLHSSNRLGILEPCGCQVNPFGGIDREANAVAQIRAAEPNVLFVDSGNLLNGAEETLSLEDKTNRANVMIQMLNESGLEAFAPGPLDYALGVRHLRSLSKRAKFPFISTNVTMASGGEPAFQRYAIIERGGVRYGILSVSDPAQLREAGIQVDSPQSALHKWVPEVKKRSDIIILLGQLPTKDYRQISREHDIQIIVGSAKNFGPDRAILYHHGKTLLADTQEQGYLLGRVDINFNFPFKGFTSDEEIARNRTGLAEIKKANPDSEWAKNYEAEKLLVAIPGGSEFSSELIRLDAERFGAPNTVTDLKESYYKTLQLSE